jgi:hypothetical protein
VDIGLALTVLGLFVVAGSLRVDDRPRPADILAALR